MEATRPELMPLYHSIYTKKDNSYWTDLQEKVHEYADRNGMRFIDNITPDGRSPKGHPAIIDYLYHEQVRGSDNTGRRNL